MPQCVGKAKISNATETRTKAVNFGCQLELIDTCLSFRQAEGQMHDVQDV